MSDNAKWCLYMHVNKINDKKYVGITCQNPPEKRWMDGYGYKYQRNNHFWNAIQRYGWDNFEHIILKNNLTQEEANELEIKTIAEMNLQDQQYGYNICNGGGGASGYHHSDESKKKMHDAKNGKNHWRWGTHLSDETKRKISEAQKGRPALNKGIKYSEEIRRHMSEGKYKPVIACDDDGNEVKKNMRLLETLLLNLE